LKCFTGPYEDSDLFIALPALRNFVSEVGKTQSVDGFLVKLTTFVLRLEDLFGGSRRAGEVLRKVLLCDEVQEVIAPFANYRHYIVQLAYRDPRFKPLQHYIGDVIWALSIVKPIEKPLEIVRPPMSVVERDYSSTPGTTATESSISMPESREPALPEPNKRRYKVIPVAKRPTIPITGGGAHLYRSSLSRSNLVPILLAIAVAIAVAITIYAIIVSVYSSPAPMPQLLQTTITSPRYAATVTLPLPDTAMNTEVGRLFDVATLSIVRRAVYGSELPRSVVEAVLGALDWASKNIVYGEDTSSRSVKLCDGLVCHVAKNPLGTIDSGRGVCIDYAVLIASALLSVNISPVYIVIFDDYNHAVVAIEIGNAVFILDQQPPPIELEDYFKYILQNKTRTSITVFKLMVVNSYVTYETAELPSTKDTWPLDRAPDTIGSEIVAEVSSQTGLYVSIEALMSPRLIVNFNITIMKMGSDGTKIVEWALYSPIFHRYWVKHLAQRVLEVIKDYLEKDVYRYIWVTVGTDRITVYLS
jgi:hypothetical protein